MYQAAVLNTTPHHPADGRTGLEFKSVLPLYVWDGLKHGGYDLLTM
jgi:hypothetical protein